MKARLDQYYTTPATARRCWRLLEKRMPKSVRPEVFIEPSAGDGAFYDLFPAGARRIGVDLEPTRQEFVGRDFLAWRKNARHPNRDTVVVGNPPFGLRGALAAAFFNHAATMADTIAFIVPVIFRKHFIHRHLVEGWRLLSSTKLGRDAFIRSDGRIANVNTDYRGALQ